MPPLRFLPTHRRLAERHLEAGCSARDEVVVVPLQMFWLDFGGVRHAADCVIEQLPIPKVQHAAGEAKDTVRDNVKKQNGFHAG